MKVFLGSTKESEALVDWASAFLFEELSLDPLPWNDEEAFPSGISALAALMELPGTVDGAILFLTADDVTKYRGATTFTPRDNIIFEAGLFLGVLGEQRTYLVVQKGVSKILTEGEGVSERVRLPSDLAGITLESFKAREKVPPPGLKPRLRNIAEKLETLGPRRSAPKIIRDLQQQDDFRRVDAAVAPFRRSMDAAVYPRVGRDDVAEVDAIVAYRFSDVAGRVSPNLQRANFRLRLCLANMWDTQLAQIYLRKYEDRSISYLQNAVKESITGVLGRLTGRAPSFVPKAPPGAKIEIYLTPQRTTHAYYRIDNLACVAPLDMKKSADPSPPAWVFTDSQSPETFGYYKDHFNKVISEAIRVYP